LIKPVLIWRFDRGSRALNLRGSGVDWKYKSTHNVYYVKSSITVDECTDVMSDQLRQSRFEWKTPLNLLNPLIPVGLSILGKPPSQDF
jgi:hypothetical protein